MDLPSLPDAVVADMEIRHAEPSVDAGVDEHNVGVAAWRDGYLARVEAQQASGVGRHNIDKALQRHAPFDHPFVVGNADPRLGAVVATGDIVDVLAANLEGEGQIGRA